MPPPPPTTPPPPSPLPTITDVDVAKAAQAFIGIMPGPSQVDPRASSSRARSASSATRGRSASHAQGSRNRLQNKARLASDSPQPRKAKLDERYFKEYQINYGRLIEAGVPREEQQKLERGITGMAIIKMQQKKLAELSARKRVVIAPKPVTKKGGPSN